MTREKEIAKASAHRFDEWGEQAHALELAFQAGCHWSDSHPHWISVEDALPKERDWYLIYDTNMGHDVCMWYGDCWGNCYKVTHWMPLPSIEHFADVSKKTSSSSGKPNNHFPDVNKMVSGSSEFPNNLKGGEQ